MTGGEPVEVTIGIDLGGTGTRIVALDRAGTVRRETTRPTPNDLSPDQAFAVLSDLILDTAQGSRPTGIGIGASGPIDAHGVIRNSDTLPAFTDMPLTANLTDRTDLPCVIDNDAVTAAVGEHRHGAGRGSDALLTVTLGTGIGVAMLVAGVPARAADGSHPEAGHITVDGPTAPCYCWLDPCWEQVASRTALDRLTDSHAAEVADLARSGDPSARDLFWHYGTRVAAGLATLVTLYRPDRLVLGGSAAQYLDIFAGGLHDGMERSAVYSWNPNIVTAELGSVAGAVGAAVLARPGA